MSAESRFLSLLAAVVTLLFSVSISFVLAGSFENRPGSTVGSGFPFCNCPSVVFVCRRFKQGWPRVSREYYLLLVQSRHGARSACVVSHLAIKWTNLSLDKLRLRPLLPTLSALCVAVAAEFAELPS